MKNFDVYNKILSNKKIGRKDVIFEINETRIGKNKHRRGHVIKGFWEVGMVQKTERRQLIVIRVERSNADTLIPLILSFVDLESTVHTDLWRAYNGLIDYFEKHEKVNHSFQFKDPRKGVHTNTIEENWIFIKESIPSHCRTSIFIQIHVYEKGNASKKVLKWFF